MPDIYNADERFRGIDGALRRNYALTELLDHEHAKAALLKNLASVKTSN